MYDVMHLNFIVQIKLRTAIIAKLHIEIYDFVYEYKNIHMTDNFIIKTCDATYYKFIFYNEQNNMIKNNKI